MDGHPGVTAATFTATVDLHRRVAARLLRERYGVGPDEVEYIPTWEPDAETRALLEELLTYPDTPPRWRSLDLDASPAPFLPIEFRRGDLVLRYFTTLTTLGTPHDITLQELRVESFFPADAATEEATVNMNGGPGNPGRSSKPRP
jgi:hypothetical protein